MSKYAALAKRKAEPNDAAGDTDVTPEGRDDGSARDPSAEAAHPAPAVGNELPSAPAGGTPQPAQPASVQRADSPPSPTVQSAGRGSPMSPAPAGAAKKLGKRSDPSYKTLGAYVNKDRIRAVNIRLAENGQELSDIVDALLQGWLEGRFRVEVPTRR